MTFRANSLTYTQPRTPPVGMPSPTRPEDLR